jgi:hypothetical protein
MRLLIEVAVLCCAALLLVSAALWWSTRQPRNHEQEDFAEVMRRARNRPHPRLDLASGQVPAQQQVNTARRRRTDRLSDTGQTLSDTRAAAYAQRQDRAYSNRDLGDLSDPDLSRPAAESIRRRPLA